MARVNVVLDSKGMEALLKSSGVAAVVNSAADAVAAEVDKAPEVNRHGAWVGVRSGMTDRARAVVTIMHPGGIGMQAKYGTLTRAVTAAGLSSRKAGKLWRRSG